jgi:DNA-binding NarL/FixJ family response regulator
MKDGIRVLLCDDRPLVRARSRETLANAPAVSVIGEADGGHAGVRMALELKPDVVVMDVDMPDLDGIEATRQILAQAPYIKVLAFSAGSSWSLVREMLSAGASGYLVKGSDPDELVRAITAVMAGTHYLSGQIRAQLTPGANPGNDLFKRPAADTRAPGAMQVVLVDDSSIVRERIAVLLSALDGVEIAGQAGDVPSGARLIHERQPHVLILDLDLPGQSGIELLESAKRRDGGLLVIILTNYDHPKLRQRCAELGADFYFHKLTELEKVLEVCRDLAHRRGGASFAGHPHRSRVSAEGHENNN